MPEPGDVLADRYELVKRLGSGGMAVVWAARDRVLGRTVALKRLHAPTEEASKRFLREAQLGAGLRHPNLVTVYDVLSDPGGVLLVMELVDGPSLAGRLEGGRLSPLEVTGIVRDVAAALDDVHGRGIVHRDVKPANVLLDRRRGLAKLADLGIARPAEGTQLTAAGALVGTAAYLAPEQFDGAPATPASDVYALAAVAFEALSGRAARQGTGPLGHARLADEPPPDLREAWPEAPAAAAAVLREGMAREPAERPPSASAFADALAAALEPDAPPVAAPRPARRPVVPMVLAGLALAAVVAVLVAVVGDGEEGRQRAGAPPATVTATPTPSATAEATQEADPAGDPAAPAGAPEAAVRAFYERAAADDFAGAWELAGPDLRATFGSQSGLEGTLGTLESIEFPTLEVTERSADRASVRIATVARHTTYTDRCRGSVPLRRAGGAWKLDTPQVRCERG